MSSVNIKNEMSFTVAIVARILPINLSLYDTSDYSARAYRKSYVKSVFKVKWT